MAYTVLLSLSQTIHQILNPDHKFPISDIGKQQIESLRKQVIFLQEFVEKYPDEAKNSETSITTAANEAEDILEHFMYEHIRWHHKSVRLAEVRKTTVQPTTDLYDFRELKIATDEIESLAREAADIKSRIGTDKVPHGDTSAAELPTLDHTLLEDFTVGLEKDMVKITDLVCEGSPDREIIPITGMGGIGKTTLARNAYNHALVKQKFRVRAWVTVSHDYKINNIFAHLLESLKDVDPETYGSSDAAQDKIYKILNVRKYLIVVDDLWSREAWDDIRRIFPRGSNGSRVVITTREDDVASHAGSSASPHKMRFLDKGNSWTLLERKVFLDKKCPSQLKEIGEGISESCGGLPLAIVLVAGILSNVQQNRHSWEEIAKDVRAAVGKESEGKFEERISLSYAHLPHYLRPCFLYMGGFPEDHEIRASKLLKLWIAEGFVKPREGQTVEAGAEKFLEALVRRNLALLTSIKSNGKVKSCNVHDMVRDLCKTKSLDENYERRQSINHPDLTRLARAYGSTLRSVISFQPNESSLGGLRKFRLLRLLDVVDTDAYSLPAPVFELFHLRYLAFGCPMEVPTAISRLQNLRTLIIRPSKRFRKYSMDEIDLPLEIWSLPLLKDLFSFFDLLPNPEGAASPLQELLTLSVVKKLICTEELMKMIPNIKKLGITYFGDKYKQDYQLQNLVLLQHLEKLKLVMEAKSPVQLEINPVFPKKLRKLTLSGWRRDWRSLEILSELPKLQVLKLRDHACKGDTWATTEDQFPSLEYLLIDTSDMKVWETEKSHFLMLKRLVLYRCSLLTTIPESIGEISTLRLIEVYHSNEPLVECVQEIYTDQKENYGNQTLRVDAVHHKVT